MLIVRSIIYNILFYIFNVLVPTLIILSFAFPLKTRLKVSTLWGATNLFCLRHICHLNYEVEGFDNIPKGACIFAGKHQSTWETFAFTSIFPSFVWVLKKELTTIPVFGWCLRFIGTIAIDRSAGMKTVTQLTQEGKNILAQGLSIFVFPEGTRIAPRGRGQYRVGASVLAKKNHVPIIPIAHNAGEYWRAKNRLIFPGTIHISVGKPIETKGKKLAQINQEVEDWIEAEMLRINAEFDRTHPGQFPR